MQPSPPCQDTGSVVPVLGLFTCTPSLVSKAGPQSCVSLVSNQVYTSDKGSQMPLLASAPAQPPSFRAVIPASPFHTWWLWQSFLGIYESESPRLFRISLTGRANK